MNQRIKNIILNLASRKGQIVYGQRAINQQIPNYLKRKTVDFDIYTKNPKGAAKELLKRLGKDYELSKARYGRTWKVKNKLSKENVADYTQPSRHPEVVNVLGVKYANLSAAERKIRKILRDKNSNYRWEKDREMLKKIKQGMVKVW